MVSRIFNLKIWKSQKLKTVNNLWTKLYAAWNFWCIFTVFKSIKIIVFHLKSEISSKKLIYKNEKYLYKISKMVYDK